MDWFETAMGFKEMASGRLSPTDFLELEQCEPPTACNLPRNIAVQAKEIPAVYKVQDEYAGGSGFRYFMDGVQRTVLWQHYNFDGAQVPIFLHFSGAVILERVKADRFVPVDSLYKSAVLLPTFLYEKYAGTTGLVDTGAERYWDLGDIRARASARSRDLRQGIEEDLLLHFLETREGAILLKDGNILGTTRSSLVIGLVKTHQTLYLQEGYPLLQQLIWGMGEFYRSMDFSLQLHEGSRQRVGTFYLRVHPPSHPEMGLLRVEYNPPSIPIDTLASWLIAERCIRANSARWDRQIYPVQACEDYLRTQLPPLHHIQVIVRSF